MRKFISSAALLLLLSTAVFFGCSQPTDSAITPDTDETVEANEVSFANDKCPIMGGKPTAELTAQYDGKTIGFCCDGCPEKWAGLSDEEKARRLADAQ